MTTFLALAGIIAVCVGLGIIFKPRYGAYQGCIGEALESVEREREAMQANPEKNPPRPGR